MKIQAVNTVKTYGAAETRVSAVKDCSFQISQGEQIAITGESGSGKSTLLHLLGGLDTPTSGSILWDNENIAEKKGDELARLRLQHIGFVFQTFNLLPELTAYENIALPLLLAEKKVEKAYVEKIAQSLGIGDRLSHRPDELSGGQQQRVAIARAMAGKPSALLCDEPTGNLDSANTRAVIDLLRQTAEAAAVTLIVVTHNEQIARQYQRIITIHDGTVGGDI